MSLYVISIDSTIVAHSFVPDEHAEGLLIAHLHEKRTDEESQTLAIADLVVIQAEALQHSSEHLLPFAFRILEHVHARKTATKVLVDDVLIRARFAAQIIILILNQFIPRPRRTLPHHTPQRRRYSSSNLVQCESRKPMYGLRIVSN